MEIGIGLPSTVPGFSGSEVVEWARRAEALGFSTLGVIDRLVYANAEPLTVLAAAAAVTTRIRLATTILVAPARPSGALLAKQVASVDRLSGGRLTLGLGVGGRADDFAVTGTRYHERGRRFAQMLAEMRDVWAGSEGTGEIGPAPVQERIPVLLGGRAEAVFRRVGEVADGWISTGGRVEMFSELAPKACRAWTENGRPGRPRLAAIGYFALGDGARHAADEHLLDYYAFLGDFAKFTAAGALTDAGAVRETVAAFAEAGCDELILHPCLSDPEQVTLLARALA
ncbi:LLM class flavin-dependent oxidoreductase [Micromonospora carbonacea]|uniref:LLM class flavin-dependent oxidoreductase n=1 Tax=Micromonospora carbonacea TaxID=47853 RepID=A0A7H8XP75_9ACTN|nr:LLM class flavin-dependent oxidoreductase [Micromonospora carbonacea]MBB5825918.1 alkanesulfonate monooxygenase SsuD/methylene tetrahydromethanopterin reductase-like flavin-dependent oxidoreductase (luciferase family) [Micromonospora carbonacea]QLD25511.1 LLM class flavin-dependent oxidoreductase [Micromonospora carbonacea]